MDLTILQKNLNLCMIKNTTDMWKAKLLTGVDIFKSYTPSHIYCPEYKESASKSRVKGN